MKKAIKFFLGLIFCNLYRFLRIFPNNDPIMGFALPFARQYKWWQAFLFPAIAMASFDVITMKLGIWTLGTALSYGFVGLIFFEYFKRSKKTSLKKYAGSSIAGVLIFDFFTGPVMSSFLFKIPFSIAFVGQIPFTIMHLASATAFTIALAPILDAEIRTSLNSQFAKFLDKARVFSFKQFLRL